MIKLTRNVELKSNPVLNTNAVVLAIVKNAGETSLFTDRITQSLLKLANRSIFNIEKIEVTCGPWGPDSPRIKSIVWNLATSGFLERDIGNEGPVRITPRGEELMRHTLLENFHGHQQALSWFLLVLENIMAERRERV